MLNAEREFVLTATGAQDADLTRLTDGKLRVDGAARTSRTRRIWLDTFDWRLYRAGLILEQRGGGGSAELILTGRDGAAVAVQAAPAGTARAAPKWPALADALPTGPVRDRLLTVAGIRALAPVAKAASAMTRRRAVNSDRKTVAIVSEERLDVSYPERAQARPRLLITALRGYQPQAERLTEALLDAGALEQARQSALEAALDAAGGRPADYSGKISVQLDPAMPARLALATVLRQLARAMEVNLPGTIADVDTEFLHDFRVAVRRTRSVLKTSAAALPERLVAEFAPGFKWLGDLTTPTRDLDVYQLQYQSMADGLTGAAPADLEPFRDLLARRRAGARRVLVRGLRSARFRDLMASWHQALDELAADPLPRPAVGKLAATEIATAHRKVLRLGRAITPDSPPADLHRLRKRAKELRYLLEVFASLHRAAEHARAVNELKALQNCLGEFQDTEVQRAELLAFAEQLLAERAAPARALLAMGEISASLAVRQHRARTEFADRFAVFSGARGVARFGVLTAAP